MLQCWNIVLCSVGCVASDRTTQRSNKKSTRIKRMQATGIIAEKSVLISVTKYQRHQRSKNKSTRIVADFLPQWTQSCSGKCTEISVCRTL